MNRFSGSGGTNMELEFKLDKEQWQQKTAVLRLGGHLDRAFQPEMDDQIQSAIDGGFRFFAIDLEGVEYVSSSGIAAMVNLKGKLDRITGNLCLFSASPRVEKVLDVMGLKRAYSFYENEAQAKEVFPE